MQDVNYRDFDSKLIISCGTVSWRNISHMPFFLLTITWARVVESIEKLSVFI